MKLFWLLGTSQPESVTVIYDSRFVLTEVSTYKLIVEVGM
jgi:hypothetical protein